MLCKIRLQLAPNARFLEGNSAIGYEFLAPLDSSCHIDAESWRKERMSCTVKHFDLRLKTNTACWFTDFVALGPSATKANQWRKTKPLAIASRRIVLGQANMFQSKEENEQMLSYRVASVLPAGSAKVRQHAAWAREK